MAKKKKNIRHTEAIQRKINAATEMAKLGLKLEDNQTLIGFVFNHLAVSHLTYFGINSINKVCRNYAGIDICIFTQHIVPSCIQPLCPVFNISDLIRWHDYPLITTSIGTTIEALSSNAPIIYHFCFDPEFIDKPYIESLDLKSAFCDPRVKIIVRHKNHQQLLEEEFQIKVCDIIPDFDVEKIAKLVITEMKDNEFRYLSELSKEFDALSKSLRSSISAKNCWRFITNLSMIFTTNPNIRWSIFGNEKDGIMLVLHSQKSKRQVTFEFPLCKTSINVIQIDEQMHRFEYTYNINHVSQFRNAITWLNLVQCN